jgi:predicted ester cyclase
LTLDDLLAEGDRVVQRFTLTGPHTGDFLGLSPCGTRLMLTGLALGRITYGQIVEEWRGADWLSWYQQLGLVLEPILDKLTSKGVMP